MLREVALQPLPDFERRLLIANREPLDAVEQVIGHEVALVGLAGTARPQFSRRCLHVHRGEGRDRADAFRPAAFEPEEPAAEVGLVDAGNRGDAAGGVAIHRGVANGSLGPVAGGDEQCAADVGEHPDARGANPGLDVLERDVVMLPIQRPSHRRRHDLDVATHDGIDVELVEFGTKRLGEAPGGLPRHRARIGRCLVDADEHPPDELSHVQAVRRGQSQPPGHVAK